MPLSKHVVVGALFLGLTFLAGCARLPDLVGVDNPEFPAASVAAARRHNIFLASTRQASDISEVFYSGRRAPALGLASVSVSIPPTHVPGEIERPSRLPPDPRTEFAIVDPTVYDSRRDFIAALDRELMKRHPGNRDVLVFIHGYNNSTSDAILRLGQFVEDSGFQGVPVLFTWASAAKPTRYVYDLNSALIARVQLKRLGEMIRDSRTERADLFAHSMGTLLVMEGLVDAQLSGQPLVLNNRVRHIVLASPDIDIDLFRTQFALLSREVRDKLYILVSQDDSALNLSRRVAGGVPRLGAQSSDTLEGFGVTVIDLTEIDVKSSSSHAKFAASPDVVKMIGDGLNQSGDITGYRPGSLQAVLDTLPIRIVR